jgi:hypothetical protein
MPTYLQDQPASSKIVEPKFQLKEARGAVPDTIQPPELPFILDRSPSMGPLATEAIDGFNALVAEQQTVNPSAKFTFSLFCSDEQLVHNGIPLNSVSLLTGETYVLSGGTALNDAIGSMIQRIGKRAKRSTRVLIAILTDGEENSSRQFSRDDIMRMITYRRTTYDWQFVFIGPEEARGYAFQSGSRDRT